MVKTLEKPAIIPETCDLRAEDWDSPDTFHHDGKLYRVLHDFSVVEVEGE